MWAKCTFTNLGCNLAIYLTFTADNSYPALTNLIVGNFFEGIEFMELFYLTGCR